VNGNINLTDAAIGAGIYLRSDDINNPSRNINISPLLLYEGMISGNGSGATPWGLNLASESWTWGQDPITYHGGSHSFRIAGANTNEAEVMRITNTGIVLDSGSGASITFQDGTVQSTAYAGVTCGGDYAESVDVSGSRTSYEPGDVLVIGVNSGSDVAKSAEPYSTLVAGIYSTRPGTVGRRQITDPKASKTEVPMAMMGIVPTKVSAENGPIKRGDLLVTSSTVAYAMKGTDRSRMLGAVIGKAMGNLDSGTGVIEVLVTLQ
jgi:hypothetical protein